MAFIRSKFSRDVKCQTLPVGLVLASPKANAQRAVSEADKGHRTRAWLRWPTKALIDYVLGNHSCIYPTHLRDSDRPRKAYIYTREYPGDIAGVTVSTYLQIST